jgi:hypothetical protein
MFFMEENTLDRARQLLEQRQYDQARQVLAAMPNDPTAQQWLQYLDYTLSQQQPPAQPQPAPSYTPLAPAYAPQPPANALAHALPLAFRPNFKLIVAGILGVLGLIMIILFFFTPMLDLNNYTSYLDRAREALRYERDHARDDYDRSEAVDALADIGDLDRESDKDRGVSGWEIWIGDMSVNNNDLSKDWGGSFTLNADTMEQAYEGKIEDPDDFGGFGDVRFIDRLLILFVIGGLAVIGVSILYALNILPAFPALATTSVFAFLMVIYAFAWPSLSTSNWRGATDDQINKAIRNGGTDCYYDDYYEDTYCNNYWDLDTRVMMRVAKDDLLDQGEAYLEKIYNLGGIKIVSLLIFIVSVGALATTWYQQRMYPEIARPQPVRYGVM